jgi:phage/plasmid-associated DNA primase
MTCGFLLASNNKPQFMTVDHAIRRRLMMIACTTMFRDDTTDTKYDPAHPSHL